MADRLRPMLGVLLCLLPAGLPALAMAADGRGLFLGYAAFENAGLATRSHRPPQLSSCANCHGDRGEGRREGGVDIPPITASALSGPRQGRPGYRSQAAIAAAVADGVGRGGEPLGDTMPRFSLHDAEMTALLAYLTVVGTRKDNPPGVAATDVRIGTLLPLSGESSTIGLEILKGLRAAIDPVNRQGGVNGRHVTLIAEDTARSGDLDAAKRLVDRRIYALAGGVFTAEAAVSSMLSAARVSSIATLVSRASMSGAGDWSADLLPPAALQLEVLDRALAQCGDPGTPRLALSLSGADRAPSRSNVRYVDGPDALRSLVSSSAGPGCIGFGLNRGDEVETIAAPGWREIVVSPFAGAVILPDASQSAWYRLGLAAARVTLEALASAGDVLSERSLLDATAGMGGFSPIEGAPVSYSRSRRYGWDPTIIDISAPQSEAR